MRKSSGFAAALLSLLIVHCASWTFAQEPGKSRQAGSCDQIDASDAAVTTGCDGSAAAVEFIKRFRLGMSYKEVQTALPKEAEQDILCYLTGEEVFLLNVDLPGAGDWSASFRFDTADSSIRQPEHLVEMSCSASLSSRNQSFDALVGKVTAAFGEPVKVDRAETKIQQAGWRVVGGSMLILEYSVMPNGIGNNVTVEFTFRKNSRHKARPDEVA